MSSLLRPIVLDTCETSLRGRRRSSIRPLSAVPRLLSATSSGTDECAVDDTCTIEVPGTTSRTNQLSQPPSISPLSDAHISDYFTSTAAPRHKNSAPPLYTSDSTSSTPTYSPTSTFVQSDLSGRNARRKSSYLPSRDSVRWRLVSGYFAFFLCGWGDGITATVLPFFTADFHLTPVTSSLLFSGSTCGYAIGTLLVEPTMKRLGTFYPVAGVKSLLPPRISQFFPAQNNHPGYSAIQARFLMIAISSMIHAIHFIMIGGRGGFGATFMAYAVAAFSRAWLTACLNVYFASGPQGAFGYSYGLWSLGGVMSPIICQTIVSSGVPWFHFYFGSLVLSGLNTTLLIYTFKPTQHEFSKERDEAEMASNISPRASSSPTNERESLPILSTPPASAPPNMFRFALTLPYQWAFSVFILLYCGSETSTQGFMVTYLLATRHANRKTVGYVTSGFWGGITVGRFVWGYLTPRLLYWDAFLALSMQLLIWFINSTIENAISTSIIGALYGPVFPATLSMANQILPAEVHMASMTIISAFASIGSAILPLIAGSISSVKGAQTLTYLTVPLGATLICFWSLFPSRVPSRNYTD